MHLERRVAMILLASTIAACSRAEVPLANSKTGQQLASSNRAESINGNEFLEVASRAAMIEGYETVVAQGDGQIFAVVLYRLGDAEANPPACVFRLVEATSAGASVIDSSDALIGCPLDSSAEEVRASTTLTVGPTSVSVEREAAKGREEFLLERGRADGIWYVTKASFTNSEEDAATGDMVVSIAEATYPATSDGVALGKYSYAGIEDDLVKRVVE
jgi:hypothetical protein